MNWTSAVDALGSTASSIGKAASSGGIWDGVSNFATNAFNWIGDNPEAANMIGGVALGAAQGYMQDKQNKDQRAFERDMYERQREDRMAKPGEVNNYGSHLDSIAGKGLLSGGMITGEEV
ncbi:MAG: hypothetical protein ACLFSR_10485 [Halomonas sp.]